MIRRAPREQGFTVLQNDTLEDDRLSWEALGLLSFLLSKPDDWTVSKQHLISCRDAGDHKIKRILRELQEAGYLSRQRKQDEEGKFVWESVVYDTPRRDGESIPRKSIDGSSIDGSSIDGKPPDITKTDSNKHGENKNGEESAPAHEDPVDVLVDLWDVRPTAYQKDRIRQVVDDVGQWEDVLDDLKMQNKDSKKAIGWAVEDYQEQMAQPNGQTYDDAKQNPEEAYERISRAVDAA